MIWNATASIDGLITARFTGAEVIAGFPPFDTVIRSVVSEATSLALIWAVTSVDEMRVVGRGESLTSTTEFALKPVPVASRVNPGLPTVTDVGATAARDKGAGGGTGCTVKLNVAAGAPDGFDGSVTVTDSVAALATWAAVIGVDSSVPLTYVVG